MKRLAAAFAAGVLTVALAAVAQADSSEYAIKAASASISDPQAGSHPDFSTLIELKTESDGELPATTESTVFELPAGLLANPNAVPKCSAEQFANTNTDDPSNSNGCPVDSQVGVTEVFLRNNGSENGFLEPVYNLEPRFGEPARLGFIADAFPVYVDTELRSDGDYGATAKATGIGSLIPLISAKTTIWGVPADSSHDAERLTSYEALHVGHPDTPSGKRSSSLVPTPFMLNPVRCGVAQGVRLIATPYVLPELHSEVFAPLPPNTGCGLLEFKPAMSVEPTTSQAETGSGLDVDLKFPTDGLEHPNLLAGDDQRKVEVALPEGMTVNPSEAAGGLGVCSEADFDRETPTSLPNEGCPETAKIGTVTATSPLLEEPAEGALFLAKPYENPFGTLLSIDMVLKVPDRGVIVKLPGRVEADPATGGLTTTFDEIPQLPVSSFHLHFREGARAPLVTPRSCGSYASDATFTSWGGKTVVTHPTFEVTSGVNGGACPKGGLPPFHPGLLAGTTNNAAGHYSPFYTRLTREDGEQEITHFSVKLPPGVVGKLAGIPFCPDAAIAAAAARTGPHGGQEELESPSCPAASRIGDTQVGSGVGQVLAYVPGKVYLAGPYHGSPLSIVAITAAKVGPFDLGTVVVREALRVNPETAEVFIDATGSDPIPHIIQGIPVHLRDIRVYVDRPEFVLNPTGCEPTSTASTVLGSGLDFTSEADDNPLTVTTRFQAADCASLGFKPKLSLQLRGGVKRGDNPALRAVLRPRVGDANSSRVSVALPHSEFLDQGHIRTICTRVQFKAGAGNGAECPAGAVYGHAKAWTPLFSEPLEGPIFLRSSEHPLPDLVLALHGLVDVDAVGRIDSVKGGIRNTFDFVPDAPITKVLVSLEGGKKGLLENSTDICVGKHPATVKMEAHNGKVHNFKAPLQPKCPRKRGKGQ